MRIILFSILISLLLVQASTWAQQASTDSKGAAPGKVTPTPSVKNDSAFATFLLEEEVSKKAKFSNSNPNSREKTKVKPFERLSKVELGQWKVDKAQVAQLDGRLKHLLSRNKSMKQRDLEVLLSEVLAGDPTPADERALCFFLVRKAPALNGLELVSYLALKNDVLVHFLKNGRADDDMGELMLGIVKDQRFNPVWREYVVQHLGIFYMQKWPHYRETSNQDKKLRKEFQRVLAACLNDPDDGISGTALLVLSDLSVNYPEFERTTIAQHAERIALSESSCKMDKIAALQSLGELELADCSGALCRVIEDKGSSTHVRVAAVGALSRLAEKHQAVESELMSMPTANEDARLSHVLNQVKNRVAKKATKPSGKTE